MCQFLYLLPFVTVFVNFIDICMHLINLQAFGGDDSDVGSPTNRASEANSDLLIDSHPVRDSNIQIIEQQGKQNKGSESSSNEMDSPSILPAVESQRSMGEILASMDPGIPLPVSGVELGPEKAIGKLTSSNPNGKRSTFWGRSTVSNCLFNPSSILY